MPWRPRWRRGRMTEYTADDTEARALRRRLADKLRDDGALTGPEWHRIFTAVPRHPFVPRVFLPSPANDGRYRPLDGTRPENRSIWLRHVYRDDICITQLDGDDRAWEVASQEDELTSGDGDRVLEVGTGTGYNAGLLCERLGADAVTSIDIDPVLVDRARTALGVLGYTPTLATVDGALGFADAAPYTRVMATASFPSIPHAWIEQTSKNGLVLANLTRPLGGGALARLTVRNGTGEGRFSARSAGFMPTRSHHSPTALHLYRQVSEDQENAATVERADVDLNAVLDTPDIRFFVALRSDVEELGVRYPDHPAERWLLAPDGSWAFATTEAGRPTVRQGGGRRLFDEVAALYTEWIELGEPARDTFGLTVSPDSHVIWQGSPVGDRWWPLADSSADRSSTRRTPSGASTVKELGRLMTNRPADLDQRPRAHGMGIYKRYFDLIASGEKTTEVRVDDISRKRLKEGDLLRFKCRSEEVLTRITRIARYDTFDEMFEHEPVSSVDPNASKADQLRNIPEIYPPEREALGVVAIGIELVEAHAEGP
ncbi:ASCH domain-containing protein [Nocardiopsis sp. RSe5-2]|uniref:Protein-L-isoaspartate O-methyltransferase n=1 Tax=Nocardiopsis endophytica TaxID=3018445 RepID=A0ABT4TXX5_9ACTN|nr:ASCH domain-containing protein [Nocardiopsis endophytica]MDA2809538.1 ASCH domain-containing protein [Nocardiopsis endophytica]